MRGMLCIDRNLRQSSVIAKRLALMMTAAVVVCIGSPIVRAQNDKGAAPIKISPEEFTIATGGGADLTVSVDRKVLKGKVTIKLEFLNLPKGLELKNNQAVLDQKKNDARFVLVANKDLKLDEKHTINGTVTAAETKIPVTLKIRTQDFSLQTGGLIVMAVSVSVVILLVSFCLIRVLTLPSVEEEEAMYEEAHDSAVAGSSDQIKADVSDKLQAGDPPDEDGASEQIKPAE